jgi:NAD-dependent DNA ligase (contains BRCT domain type II)
MITSKNISESFNNLDDIIQEQYRNLQSNFTRWKDAMLKYNLNLEVDMSDEEFDNLESEILEIVKDSDNPTLQYIYEFMTNTIVKDGVFTFVNQINNNVGLMVSLNKIKYKTPVSVISDIKKFFNKCHQTINEYYVAPKFDGCSLRFEKHINGQVTITTRGGLDVTKKLQRIERIKGLIENYPFATNCINGELLVKKSIFNEKYSDEYSHPRSFVSACLGSDKKVPDHYYNDLDFIACTDGCNPILTETFAHTFVWSKMDYRIGSNESYQKIQTFFNNIKSENFPYACDGIVISAKKVEHRVIKNNYPDNMTAVKFPSETAQSKVIGFNWTVKKSGKLTPIVNLHPVMLDGSKVENASGYNYEYLISNGIGIGSIVEITKSGDIIPVIVKVVVKSDHIILPEDIKYKREGKHLVVEDRDTTLSSKFINAFNSLNIKGIGEVHCQTIGSVCNFNIIEMFDPNLKLKFAETLGFDSAVYHKFCQIYDMKTFYLSDVIFMLQFDNVGTVLSEKIAQLLQKLTNDSSNIPEKVLINVCKGSGYVKIVESMKKLNDYGIKVIKKPVISENNISYEMSGDPPSNIAITKEKYVELIKKINPNLIRTTLTKNTDYLIVDSLESNSTKVQKARKYNVSIITYENATRTDLVKKNK